MKKKNDNKTKNYIILSILVLICVGLTLYFCKWYQVLDEKEKETPVIEGILPEITSMELDHYILENPTSTIYMCTASDITCRNFEKKFKKVIEKKNYENYIIYLNLSNIDQDEFIKDFNKKYKSGKNKLIKNYPAIVIFNDNKLTNVLQGSKDKKLTVEKAKTFFKWYWKRKYYWK